MPHSADVAKVSVVGIGMRSHAGVAAKMFRALADKGINIQAITTSEIKVERADRRGLYRTRGARPAHCLWPGRKALNRCACSSPIASPTACAVKTVRVTTREDTG